MLYGFRHYPTPNGRRVEFALARPDYDRAIARIAPAFFDGVARTDVGDEVRLTMTVPAAIRLSEALGTVGGDVAVPARMLAEQLDYMTCELAPGTVGPTYSADGREAHPDANLRRFRAAVGF